MKTGRRQRFARPLRSIAFSARVCAKTFNVAKFLFRLSMICVFLYVFPPYKIKEVVDSIWTVGETTARVVSAVSHSEETASRYVNHIARSSRRLWSDINDELQAEIPDVTNLQ